MSLGETEASLHRDALEEGLSGLVKALELGQSRAFRGEDVGEPAATAEVASDAFGLAEQFERLLVLESALAEPRQPVERLEHTAQVAPSARHCWSALRPSRQL